MEDYRRVESEIREKFKEYMQSPEYQREMKKASESSDRLLQAYRHAKTSMSLEDLSRPIVI